MATSPEQPPAPPEQTPAPGLVRRCAFVDDEDRRRRLGPLGRIHDLEGMRLASEDEVSADGDDVARLIGTLTEKQRQRLQQLCSRDGKLPAVMPVAQIDELTRLLAIADRLCRAYGMTLEVTGPTATGYSLRLVGKQAARNRLSHFVEGKWLEIAAVQRACGALKAVGAARVGVQYEIEGTEGAEGTVVRSDFDGLLLHGDTLVVLEAKNRRGMAEQDPALVRHLAHRIGLLFEWSRRDGVARAPLGILFVVVAGMPVQREARARMAARIRRRAAAASESPTVVVSDIAMLATELGHATAGAAR